MNKTEEWKLKLDDIWEEYISQDLGDEQNYINEERAFDLTVDLIRNLLSDRDNLWRERIEKQKPDRIIGQYQNVGNSDDGFVGTKELLDKKTVLAIISDLQKESK